MKRTLKRAISTVLAALLLLTAAPVSGLLGLGDRFGWLGFSSEVSAVPASGKCGANVSYTFDSASGLLTIYGTGDMYDYDYGDSPFFEDTSIKNVVIKSGVTSIGDRVFFGCKGLTSIAIPAGVTCIGDDAFTYCINLTSITIPDSVTIIRENAFFGCEGLTRITIPAGVKSIGDYAFSNCKGLTSITISNSVKSIGECAFRYCTGLARITIPDSVTDIGYGAFRGCTGLTSITIPDSMTSIDQYMFYGCDRLMSITVPDSVKSIGPYAFYGCSSLQRVHIPSGVSTIGGYILGGSPAYICSDTEDCYAKEYAENYGIEFRVCSGHELQVVLDRHDVSVFAKHSVSLTAAMPNDSLKPVWMSSNEKVAKVDENGNVTGLRRGTATITCTVTDEAGNTAQDSCSVTVKYTWWQWLIKILLFGWIWY